MKKITLNNKEYVDKESYDKLKARKVKNVNSNMETDVDENNFKNMEIGVIKFYDEGIYCQLKEMEIKIDE